MKKIIAILSAIAALVACVKEVPIVEEPVQEENQEIKVNINITREGIQDTKATVKTGWAAGDVVFVFINGVAAPKYLELKRVVPEAPENPYWKATCSKGMVPGDLGTSGTMTALYLPYGGNFTVQNSSGKFNILESSGRGYIGHFYYTEGATYKYDSGTNTFSTTITLYPAMPEGSDKLVHFDVTGFPNDNYWINQDYMKPMTCSGVAADGTVGISFGRMGERFRGYYDTEKEIVSFSGVLDASAVGEDLKTFRFLIHDLSDGKAYFREITNKAISGHKYISLGAKGAWTGYDSPYFSVGPTKLVEFAPGNLQYQASSGKWRFAQHQYDRISDGVGEGKHGNVAGSDNSLISPTYDGWIDLFGWGTSGWKNTTNEPTWVNYQPYSTDMKDYASPNLHKYGPANNSGINKNLQGGNAHGDWGIHNDIYSYDLSSYDPAGTWRTPSSGDNSHVDGEMYYLFNSIGSLYLRNTTTSFDIPSEYSNAKSQSGSARYVKATVAGTEGMIIFPDYYIQPVDAAVTYQNKKCFNLGKDGGNTVGFDLFVVNAENWPKMETAGAVFLPIPGNRGGNTVHWDIVPESCGGYWASDRYPSKADDGRSAYYIRIEEGNGIGAGYGTRTYVGHSVRLVRDLN